MTVTRGSRASMLVTGTLLMLLALAGVGALVQPALGQEEPDADEDPFTDEGADGEPIGEEEPAPSEDEVDTQDLDISQSAVYAHPVTDGIPPTVADNVPPQAVCVIEPAVCPEELRPLFRGVEDLISLVQDEMVVSPLQTVLPDTIAVGYFAGHERYESAISFDLPELPEDEEITSFQLYLPVGALTYDLSSPTVRDIITSAFLMIGDGEPEELIDNLADNLLEGLQGRLLDIDNEFLRMEACALTQGFEASDAPQVQHRDDMPREEPFEEGQLGEVSADCMLGGTGVLDEDAEHWVFDLTFAADAWATGEIDNHGLLISPAGVPNLAFGDPDISTFTQTSLELDGAAAVLETAEAPPPLQELDDLESPPDLDDDLDPSGELAEGPATSEDLPSAAPGPSGDGPADLDQPDVADAPDMDEPAASQPVDEPGDDPAVASPVSQQLTPVANGRPSPWAWLLVPIFAGGAWMVTRSLTAPVAAAAQSSGAMTRLLANRGGPTPI